MTKKYKKGSWYNGDIVRKNMKEPESKKYREFEASRIYGVSGAI